MSMGYQLQLFCVNGHAQNADTIMLYFDKRKNQDRFRCRLCHAHRNNRSYRKTGKVHNQTRLKPNDTGGR